MSSSLSIVALIDLCDLDDAWLGADVLGGPFFGTVPVRRAFADAVSAADADVAFAVTVPGFPALAIFRSASADDVLPAGLVSRASASRDCLSALSVVVAPAAGAKVFAVTAAARSIVC